VPAIGALVGSQLDLAAPVTFLIGENGSGKSTLLEALACAIGSITVGSESVERDPTLGAVQALAQHMKLAWNKKTRRGFFMRAEDFFGYARRMKAVREDLERELRALEANPDLSPLSKQYGSMPYQREIAAIKQSYGEGLDSYSHGESFFTLFKSRLVPNGLYLLDEPEAPLSPMRQLGLLSLLNMLVEEQGAQFIIATHSPILMAFPQAMIYSFDEGQVRQVEYESITHVTLTRDFLQNPQRFLRHL
jgi:predicted ATPase